MNIPEKMFRVETILEGAQGSDAQAKDKSVRGALARGRGSAKFGEWILRGTLVVPGLFSIQSLFASVPSCFLGGLPH